MDVSSDDSSFDYQSIPVDLNVTGHKYLTQLDDSLPTPPQQQQQQNMVNYITIEPTQHHPPPPPPRKEGNCLDIKVDLEYGKRYTIAELEEHYKNNKVFGILKLFVKMHALTYMRYFTLDTNMIGSGYLPVWRTEYCNIYCKKDRSHAFVPKYNPHNCSNSGSYSLGDESSCTLN